MSEHRIEKTVLLKYVKEIFDRSSFVYFITFKGLDVPAISDLRNRLAENGARCHVIKNCFLKLAMEELDIAFEDDLLAEDTAIVASQEEDPVSPAKVIADLRKDHEAIQFKGVWVEGTMHDAAAAAAFADMPSKEQLLSMLLATMKGPGTKLVQTLSTRRSNLVWLLENYANKLEESA